MESSNFHVYYHFKQLQHPIFPHGISHNHLIRKLTFALSISLTLPFTHPLFISSVPHLSLSSLSLDLSLTMTPTMTNLFPVFFFHAGLFFLRTVDFETNVSQSGTGYFFLLSSTISSSMLITSTSFQ